MSILSTLRNSLKTYYADYDFIIRPLIRFLLALSILVLFKNYIGYCDAVLKPVVILGASALCALFPYGCITLVGCLFVLVNMYSVSLSFLFVGSVLFLFVVFLYFGFRPGHSLAIVLVPAAFLLKVPYCIPVILGMTVGLGALIPVSIGTLLWFLMKLFHEMAPAMETTTDISVILSELIQILQGLFLDPALYVTLLAFALGIGVAAILRKMSFDHVWITTAIVSLLTVSVFLFAGNALAESGISMQDILIYTLLSLPVVILFVLMFYQVNYKATERLQFEDDDYYYYVKAVPKLGAEDEERSD